MKQMNEENVAYHADCFDLWNKHEFMICYLT